MRRDLVERRGWLSDEDYRQGLALAQLSPGPLAAQLAMYLGWVRGGIRGATLVAAAFILPSFVMVLALAALYVRFGGLPWMQGAFYGVGAAAIALIVRGGARLVGKTAGRDPLLWAIVTINTAVTVWTGREVAWVFAASGVAVWLWRSPPRRAARASLFAAWLPAWAVTGLHGPAGASTMARLAAFFGEAGLFVFGSGLAIVPYLQGGVVRRYQWLDERQFLDAVAVAMITPGPVVITVAFIGYLVAGILGALAASLGVFLPCYLFVVLLAPHYRRLADHAGVRAFVTGLTAAACGAITGAAIILGRRAVFDGPTLAIFAVALGMLTLLRRLPEPLVILTAALAGLVARRFGH